MAATCSLPLRSTAQLWEAGVHRSPARDTLTTLQSRGGERHGNNTTVGGTSSSDILRGRAQHNQLPADERRGMEGASALGPVGLRDSHQNESSSKLAGPSSHGDPTPILKRSYSTPAVRSMAQDLSTAAGEKKRNRLGYHRTSIACSHCRRRKIRCIVSPDIQNRCINCIRLKKDCSFYPVDQQPMLDSRGKPTGAGTGSSGLQSQSSSPALAPGHPIEMASRPLYGPGSTTDSMGHHVPSTVPSSMGYTSGMNQGLGMPGNPDQRFSISPGTSLAWGSAEPSPVTIPGSMDMAYAWRPYGTGNSSNEQASPFGPPSNAGSAWMPGNAGGVPPGTWASDHGLPPSAAGRSMSFSGELVGHQQPFSSVPSSTNYGEAGSELGNMLTPPLSQAPGTGQLPSHAGQSNQGNWPTTQQQILQQQQPRQPGMEFSSWGMGQGGGNPM